ncbi:MAG: phosphate ABC transporter substrate-binding protein PstS [Methanobacteriota archaeon]
MKNAIVLFAVVAMLVLAGCVGAPQKEQPAPTQATTAAAPVAAAEKITLNGAGASFPYPLISRWSFEYNKIKPSVQMNYQSIGSGGGIRQITEKTVIWAGSDVPLSDEQYSKLPGILHIPETIGAVVVAYNVPNVGKGLKLSGEVLADIFMGKITKWNDQKIAALNPGVSLPDKDIIVAHRSDGSGTTFVFTDYLSAVSDEWRTKVGRGTSVNWPVGLGGKGNEGVAGLVKQNPYSIGYVELAYATETRIPYAFIKNREGNFVEPTLASTATAAAGAVPMLPKGYESWSKVSIVNAHGKDAYPIASFTYLLVYRDQADEVNGRALVEFLWWVIHDGQKYSADLLYVPLPSEVVKLNEETIKLINYQGKSFVG